jgi:hypothetical protein
LPATMDVMTFDTRGVELIEIIDPELPVGLAGLQDAIDGNQNAVRDGGSSLVPAAAPSDAVELSVKVSWLWCEYSPRRPRP